MHANALEVALALWRMPAMRTALRERSLPEDVGQIIELAPGATGRIAAAAAGTDVTPEQLLEAVRFYIREVLMFDGADAYRVLGVARDASPKKVKAHHRALQHWLHPDRRGDDWESAYATRINTAWGEIRSPERRAAYDERRAQWLASGSIPDAPHGVLVSDWQAVRGQQTQTQWFGWVGLGLAVALCLCLIVLADRQARMPAPEWVTEPEQPIQPESGSRFAGLLERVTARPRAAEKAADVVQSPEVARLAAATLPPERVDPPPEANAEADAQPDEVLRATSANASPGLPPVPLAAAAPIALAPQAAAPVPAPAPPRATARKQAAGPVAPSQANAASGVQASPVSATAATTDIDPLLERVRLAHRRGDEITRYLAGPGDRAPPIFRNAAAFDSAASLRGQLADGRSRLARIRSPARFGEPVWRIAAERATMVSTIDRSGNGSAPASLHVELAWRDGMWLVDSIEAKDLGARNLP